MQRAEEDGHAGVLEFLELYGDGVDVLDQERVVRVFSILQRARDVEVCRRGVEARVPGLRRIVVQTGWCAPVPYKSYDAALLVKRDGFVDVGG